MYLGEAIKSLKSEISSLQQSGKAPTLPKCRWKWYPVWIEEPHSRPQSHTWSCADIFCMVGNWEPLPRPIVWHPNLMDWLFWLTIIDKCVTSYFLISGSHSHYLSMSDLSSGVNIKTVHPQTDQCDWSNKYKMFSLGQSHFFWLQAQATKLLHRYQYQFSDSETHTVG